MAKWKPIIGKSFSAVEFDTYCQSLQWTTWRPSFIVLHNTGTPNLAQRPNGLTATHIKNLESFYRDTQHWTAGPHLFIDDHQVWVFTPLTTSGVHAPSWNAVSLGIEMLGDYDKDDFNNGRGLLVKQNTIAAFTTLNTILGLDPASFRLHKEDPLTTHKSCPGSTVNKNDLIHEVQQKMAAQHAGEHQVIV